MSHFLPLTSLMTSTRVQFKCHFKSIDKGQLKVAKGFWSPEEDAILKICTSENTLNNEINWNAVAIQYCKLAADKNLAGRLKKQCLKHYNEYLDPNIKKRPFNKKEINLIKAKYPLFPNEWAQLMQFFPGRTANAIRTCATSLFNNFDLEKVEKSLSRRNTSSVNITIIDSDISIEETPSVDRVSSEDFGESLNDFIFP